MKHEDKTDWERVDGMTDEDISRGIAVDPDAARELDAGEIAQMRPAAEVLPELVYEYRKSRGRQKAPAKVPVSIRLSPDIVDYFKAQGQGWQTRINEVLEEYVISKQ